MMPGNPPPTRTKKEPRKLYVFSEGIYQRFQISLNDPEVAKFRDFASDFASWSQKWPSGGIGQNFKIFLFIECNEMGIN